MADDGITNAELQHRAVRGWLWTVVSIVVNLPILVAANVFIARSLRPEQYGQLAFLMAAFAIALTVANLGVQSGLVQWGAAFESIGLRSSTNEILRRGLGFYMLVETPALVIVMLLILRGSGGVAQVILIFGLLATTYFTPSAVALTAASQVDKQAKLGLIGTVVVQGASVFAAVAWHSAVYVFVGRLIVGGILGATHLYYLDRSRRIATLVPRLPRRFGDGFWRFSIQSCASQLIASLVFSRSEIFVLQAFHMTAVLGVFALAYGLAAQITAPVDGLLGPLLPAMAGVVARDASAVTPALMRGTRLSSLGASIVMLLALPPIFCLIPVLYGPMFDRAAWPFVFFGVVSCLQTSLQTFTAVVAARRQSGLILKANILGLLVNALLALTLIPILGLGGAVTANCGSQLVSLVLIVRAEARLHVRGWLEIARALAVYWISLSVTVAVTVLIGLVSTEFGFGLTARLVTGTCFTLVGEVVTATVIRLFRVTLPTGDAAALESTLPRWLWRGVRAGLGGSGLLAAAQRS